jgi:glycerol kinase
VGLWPGPEALGDLWQLDRAFEPTMDAERREALYAGWRRAVGRARDWARETI